MIKQPRDKPAGALSSSWVNRWVKLLRYNSHRMHAVFSLEMRHARPQLLHLHAHANNLGRALGHLAKLLNLLRLRGFILAAALVTAAVAATLSGFSQRLLPQAEHHLGRLEVLIQPRARCTLLACVSPAAGQLEETLSTLKFAQRAKLVKAGKDRAQTTCLF